MSRTAAMAGLAALGLAVAASGPAGAAPAGPTAKLDSGVVEGARADGLEVFKGIPYAASTEGANRWRAPQPVRAWTGVRTATAFGAACPQPHLNEDRWAQVGPQSEDCLFLNVWAPARPPKGGAAVMVFIHGGSFTRGAGGVPLYDGTALAKRGVVLVTINYRLGRLGFFAHPALTQETADGLVSNYGIMDQLAALKWVQRNISAFGGDPKKVTVFGESAGAVAVQVLATSPAAKGTFVRAIAQSGGGTAAGATLKQAEMLGTAWASGLGLKDATPAQLRAIPLAEAIKTAPAGPVIDGVLIRRSPGDAWRRGEQLAVGVIMGGNSHEANLFAENPAVAKAALGAAYPELLDAAKAAGPTKAGAESDLITQSAAIQPARYLVQRNAAAGQPSYAYYFDQVAASDRAGAKGANHGWELGYLFGTRVEHETWDAEDAAVSKAMGDYWVNFAKTGDPNGPGLPHWAPVTRTASPIMILDAHPRSRPATALEDRIQAAAVAVAEKAWGPVR